MGAGAVAGVPRLLLRLEGAAVFCGAVFFYWRLDGSWLWFVALVLAPDLAFLAYLISPRLGAIAYNAVHTTLCPLALLALAAWRGWPGGEGIALIWLAHVGLDRALFGDTHLGRLGRQA